MGPRATLAPGATHWTILTRGRRTGPHGGRERGEGRRGSSAPAWVHGHPLTTMQTPATPSGPDRSSARPLLFSIDLEEFCPADPARRFRATPLPELAERYLALLRGRGQATFFVVGETARKFPGVLRQIAGEGHELACHGDRHQTLDRLSPAEFAADLRANRDAVETASGVAVQGFRAPIFSLTSATAFAHQVLARHGFRYSSSVLPAANPLFGWPEFGKAPRWVDGVLELPMTTGRIPGTSRELPLWGGTYFRLLPYGLVRRALRSLDPQLPLQCYFHPYDIDTDQDWVMHAGVHGRRALNLLLFLRRRSLLERLDRLLGSSCRLSGYSAFMDRLRTIA